MSLSESTEDRYFNLCELTPYCVYTHMREMIPEIEMCFANVICGDSSHIIDVNELEWDDNFSTVSEISSTDGLVRIENNPVIDNWFNVIVTCEDYSKNKRSVYRIRKERKNGR